MKPYPESTIAAIATAPGAGGIGVVRVSGPQSAIILDSIFSPLGKNPQSFPRELCLGKVLNKKGQIIDEVLAVYMPAPNSYTAEDVVELQGHGGVVVTKELLRATLQAGATLAQPGEFTQRAFLNGRLDLSQAEAVQEIIQAKTPQALLLAQGQLSGALGQAIKAQADTLLDILALIEVAVDYPEEEEHLLGKKAGQVAESLALVEEALNQLLAGAESGRIYREGLTVALVGPVNAGKSSLLNALLQEERAIVTAIPGTTRDTIEEYYNLAGIPLKLVDTAGIRETADPVEAIGVERSKQAAKTADVLLLVLDAEEAPPQTDQKEDLQNQMPSFLFSQAPLIVAVNKTDKSKPDNLLAWAKKQYPAAKVLAISAALGEGLEELKEALSGIAFAGSEPGASMSATVNLRQEQALTAAANQVKAAKEALEAGISIDMASIDIQGAWQSLGEITGESATDDIIQRVFANYCLGK